MSNGFVDRLSFMAGGGRMGDLIRAFAWERTSLGSPSSWPAGLRVSVRMMLTTRHPVFIFWGPDHLCLYNDAYSESLGPEQHPGILGERGQVAWPAIWEVIGPQIQFVLRGDGATWDENKPVTMQRHGKWQDVYWTYSYGPIDDPEAPNGVGGVLVLCTETTRQVETERRLQTELERFARLFDLAPVFMTVLAGPEHRFELANPAYEALVGCTDLLGRTLVDAIPQAAGEGYLEVLDRVFVTGEPYVAEGAIFKRSAHDGRAETRILDFVIQPRVDAGQTKGLSIVGVDVTERMRAQDELASGVEQLRLATDYGGIGFWDVDLTHDTLFWPPLVKAMFGISAQQEVSMADFRAGLHPEDSERTLAAFAAATDPIRRAVYDVEYRTVGKEDGVIRWVAARGRGLFSKDGHCTRVLGTAVDITVRKRSEAQLLELNRTLGQRLSEYLAERKLLADIVDGTDAFVQVADTNFCWLAINKASADEFERIFGKRPAVGLNMLELLEDQPEQQQSVRSIWSRALSGEDFVEIGVFGAPDRDQRHYEMRFRPLFDSEGTRIGAYQFVYDVTARVQSEQRLAHAEAALHQSQKMEAVGQLTGGIAHDFNNLLQVFRTLFEVIRMKSGDAAKVKMCGERGIEATKKAARLTAQLLAFSRQQPFDIKPVKLAGLFDELETLLVTTLGTTIKLEVRWPTLREDVYVLADVTQLEMAILNIAINARDAMPAGGSLAFSFQEPDASYVTICAEDTGEGMTKEVIARAFDPFFTTKGVGRGSGLGLSQVYGMAQRADGSVALESELGIGTRVLVTLKRVAPLHPSGAAGNVASGAADAPAAPLKVLLVDDDMSVRTSVAEMLRLFGHDCVQADGGERALEILETASFDVMVVDFAMPGMNGASLAHLVRQRAGNIRTVMMSGYADIEAIEAAIGQGDVLLRKPFAPGELQAALRGASKPSHPI